MKLDSRAVFVAVACLLVAVKPATCEDRFAASLPEGVRAVWDLDKAHREATPSRERVCLNGLWRWQPAGDVADALPDEAWGYFKVPGCWPGITNYMQKDSQTVQAHSSWRDRRLGSITSAWYQREIVVPREWSGRRIGVQVEYLNSFAVVYVDGKRAGEIRFPGGEVDLTSACSPGGRHVLSMAVVAMPLDAVMLSYSDTASAKEVKGSVARRGLCGDVYLIGTPSGARIENVKVDTSVRGWEIAFNAALEDLESDKQYSLRALITDHGRKLKEFTSKPFRSIDSKDGRMAFSEKWKPEKLWDTHSPENTYDLTLSLLEADGKVVDTSHLVRFGFRELWIDGRDFFLNGTRIFLCAVPLDNAQVSAAAANYEAVRESLKRLMSFGINCVYTHNYGCQPGSHLSFAEALRAADDVGMLVSFSQPHFGHYDWEAADADQTNGYAGHAEFYVRRAGNHPSVVFYSMSHNGCGYAEDMNPQMIDGLLDPRDKWSLRNSKRAQRAEAVVSRLDPARIVYHHSSGNLSSMHTSNFYPNFVPIQELSDWFEHWSTVGVKPAFLCEYGAPFTWDWTMYRGWYEGKRSFGSAQVPWEFCLAEWNSQFLGDRAFEISQMEQRNLRWEAKQFRNGKVWHRWDYPHQVGSRDFDERYPVFAMYLRDNFRAYRTWGLSARSPWQHSHYWKIRDGVDKSRKELPVDWENLQRPGLSADYIDEQYERMDLAFERSDWIPTVAAEALIRNNRPLLAYIGGKPGSFTGKDHNFLPGETVEKQIIVINSSRETVRCECEWSFGLPGRIDGRTSAALAAGEEERIPLRLDLPADTPPGAYALEMKVKFQNGETQEDSFPVHVPPIPPALKTSGKIALFDPKGETGAWLGEMGIKYQPIDATADPSAYEMLIVGKSALSVDGPAPNIAGVQDGLKVVVFEQTSDVLRERLGFRVQEYGLRRVFKRVPDHPLLAGIGAEHLRDWRGVATILPPRLDYETRPSHGPTIDWCGIPVTRVWRCGNRGNVASVLIEKPARGDFMPIVDGGYSLQYSPLVEYREGRGMVLFCQMDVTGRTEGDPAAKRLSGNIIEYVSNWKPVARRRAVYLGDPNGKEHFEAAGISVDDFKGGELSSDQVLIVGPGAGRRLASSAAAVADWLAAGGHLLAVGLDEEEAAAFLPFKVAMRKAEHISAYFEPSGIDSPLAGVGAADVHNRDPRELPLVSNGAAAVGNGVLARARDSNVVFCQLVPWQFDYSRQYNLKRTYRRSSFLVTRLLANMGVGGGTPILARFHNPVDDAKAERRWADGLYLDQPQEWDDPYRFFRW